MTENGEPAPLSPEEEAAVHELLSSLPDPHLPADVEHRIASAVAATREPSNAVEPEPVAASSAATSNGAAHAVLTPSPPSSRWRSTWLLQSAAVLVLVALIGAIVVGVTSDDGGSGSDTPLALSQETAGPITASGREYTGATLAGQVRGLVVGTPASAAAEAEVPAAASAEKDSAPTGTGEGTSQMLSYSGATEWSTSDPAVAEVTKLVNDPKLRQACIDQLASVPGAQPVAIDAGLFDGKPAAIFVLPDENDPDRVAAWVVGPTCSSKDNPFPYRYERVVRP